MSFPLHPHRRLASLFTIVTSVLVAAQTASGQSTPPPPAPAAAPAASPDAPPPAPPRPPREKTITQPDHPPFVNISKRWPADVLDAVNGCKQAMTCPTLKQFKANHSDAYAWVKGWCQARGGVESRDKDEETICAATASTDENVLGTKSILTLAELAGKQNPNQCSGFGLTIPLYSIRYGNGDSTVKGPVAAGLGGGYYYSPPALCKETFSAGPEVFLYSEGLDPSGLFQIGVAAGFQIAAFKYFQFGLAVGYDLYRREPGVDLMDVATVTKNGLLTGSAHKADWSALITFAVFGNATSDGDSTP